MLKEEVMEIKEGFNQDEFGSFTATNIWLEKLKLLYNVRERRVDGEAGEVSEYAVNAWMEKLLTLTRDYEPKRI